MKKSLKGRGRPIEQDAQRFEVACWWAFTEMGCGPFDAARLALLATKGGLITLEDIEGTLVMASATRQAVEMANRKLRPGASADRLYRPVRDTRGWRLRRRQNGCASG
jgi:hypothetical protein